MLTSYLNYIMINTVVWYATVQKIDIKLSEKCFKKPAMGSYRKRKGNKNIIIENQ